MCTELLATNPATDVQCFPVDGVVQQSEMGTTNCRTATRPMALQKKLNAALFKAVREQNGIGVLNAVENGADPLAVSRGMTSLERAMKFFPKIWSPVAVGALIAATGVCPVIQFECERRELVEGLINHAQTAALASMMRVANRKERNTGATMIRALLAQSSRDDEGVSAVAKVAFASAADAEDAANDHKATWLHQIVCGGDSAYVGIRLAGSSERCFWHWEYRSTRHANVRVLDHILSLRPRLDVRWLGMTPFHLAAFTGDEDALEALLRAGADPDLPDGNETIVGSGYGKITNKQLALIKCHRLRKSLPVAGSKARVRL